MTQAAHSLPSSKQGESLEKHSWEWSSFWFVSWITSITSNTQGHNPAWNTVIMKHKNAIALNRNYITRTIYNSKAKYLWSACFQILRFLKSFFSMSCQCTRHKMYKAIQINPIVFFEVEAAVWAWINLGKSQDSSNLIAALDG